MIISLNVCNYHNIINLNAMTVRMHMIVRTAAYYMCIVEA